jgi:5-enolpyruvylshikimate-3-phosphate synthase
LKVKINQNLQNSYNIKLYGDKIISELIILVSSLYENALYVNNLSKHKDIINLIKILDNFDIKVTQNSTFTIVNGKNLREWKQPNNVINISSSLDILHYLVNIISSRDFRVFITGDDDFVKDALIDFDYLKNNNFITKSENKLPILLMGNYKLLENNFKIKNIQKKYYILLNSVANGSSCFLEEYDIKNEYLENILSFYGVDLKERLFEDRSFFSKDVIRCKELSIFPEINRKSYPKDFFVPISIDEAIYTIFIGLSLDIEEFCIENVSVDEFNGEVLKVLVENGVNLELKNQKVLNGIKIVSLHIKKSVLRPLSISKNRILKMLDFYQIIILLNVIKKNNINILGINEIKAIEKNDYDFLIDLLTLLKVFSKEDKSLLELGCENSDFSDLKTIKITQNNISNKMFLSIFLFGIIINKEIIGRNYNDLLDIFPNMYNVFEQLNIEVIND